MHYLNRLKIVFNHYLYKKYLSKLNNLIILKKLFYLLIFVIYIFK